MTYNIIKNMKTIVIKAILLLSLVIMFCLSSMAQPPLPPGDGPLDDPEDWQPAPIGGGIAVLIALGAVYGAKKVYDARRKLCE